MIKLSTSSILFLLAMVLLACHTSFNSAEELYKWMNNPANGLVVEKQSADKELSLKYLPIEYLVYNELKEKPVINKQLKDSLTKIYSGSRSFLLTIRYKNDEAYDPLYEGIYNYQELSERKEDMHFSFGQYVKLVTSGQKEYQPVLTHMEETYGLQKYRNIYLVFSPENKEQMDILNAENLDIVFDDRIFNTGIHHFTFLKENLDKQLKLNFLQ